MVAVKKELGEEDTAPQWPIVEPRNGAKIICVETKSGSLYEVTADPGICFIRRIRPDGDESPHRIKSHWKQCEDVVFGTRMVVVWGEREKPLADAQKDIARLENSGVPVEIVLRTTVTSSITKLWASEYNAEVN